MQGHRDHEPAEAALRVKRVLGGIRLCLSNEKKFVLHINMDVITVIFSRQEVFFPVRRSWLFWS